MTTTADIARALVAAHLLTASLEEAERATIAAIDEPGGAGEMEELLFQTVLASAAGLQVQDEPRGSGAYLPPQLRAVLRLPREPRRCFVLRALAGLSPEVCARMLSLDSDQVKEFTWAAAVALGEASRRAAPMTAQQW